MADSVVVAGIDMDLTFVNEAAGDFHLRCFDKAMRKVLGVDVNSKREIDYPGKTDLGVMVEIAKKYGVLEKFVERKDEVRKRLRFEFESGISECDIELMPGATRFADYMRNEARAVLTPMTGNSRSIAKTKISQLGAAEYFVFDIGGYGDDFESRSDIVRDMVARSDRYCMENFGKRADVYVFDDTPRGMRAALEGGAKGIGVMSGYFKSVDEFLPYKPVAVIGSLNDLSEIKKIFPPAV